MQLQTLAFLLPILAGTASAAPTTLDARSPDPSLNVDLKLYPKKSSPGPFFFTSTYSIVATPDQVVDTNNNPTGGLPNSKGYFNFGLNSIEDTICYNITLINFRGEYSSPAKTATHIHQSAKGLSGPPRIAFPNPVVISEGVRRSVGCLKGPFETGVVRDGADTGLGFTIKMLEDGAKGFNADVHSSEAVPGAVRGQFDKAKKC